MKTREVTIHRIKCDKCGGQTKRMYDICADGVWANYCSVCKPPGKKFIGTEFRLVEKKEPADGILVGINRIDGFEREVICPHCETARPMEIDAECIIECEVCGSSIRIEALI
jgi:hypothetical protein